MPEINRRTFLGMAAAGGALAAGRHARLVPWVVPPEHARPGDVLTLATTCRECPAGCGVHATHHDGRVTKLEGNPAHPISRGALCPRGQAAVQGLYAPERLAVPRLEGQDASWTAALAPVVAHLQARRPVVVISGLETGALAEVLAAFAGAFGGGAPLWYEAFDHGSTRRAWGALTGRSVIPDLRLDRSDFMLSLGTDFLGGWVSDVKYARRFAAMHAVPAEGRLVHVGPRRDLSAVAADRWLRVPPWGLLPVALALLRLVGEARPHPAPVDAWLAEVPATEAPLPEDTLRALARDLLRARAPLVLAGPVTNGAGGEDLSLAGALLNASLGALEGRVDLGRVHALSQAGGRRDLLARLEAAGPDALVLLHACDPARTAPEVVPLLERAARVVLLEGYPNTTAAHAGVRLPVDTPLESWGDYTPETGIHGLLQPTVGRVGRSRAAGDVLLDLARSAGRPLRRGDTAPEGFEAWLLARWAERGAGTREAWEDALRAGFVGEEAPAPSVGVAPPAGPWRPQVETTLGAGEAWLWPFASVLRYDGRVGERTWLQEAPEPIAGVSWTPTVDLPPDLATALGVEDGDVVVLEARTGAAEAPARVTSDVAQGTVALSHPAVAPLLAGEAGLVQVRPWRAPRHADLPWMFHTRQQRHREALRWTRPGKGRDEEVTLPLPEGYQPDRDVYPPHDHAGHRWAMVVDLDRCIGCGACVVACYAENNIPAVGAEEVRKGRELSWLKVVPYAHPEDPARLGFLPMLCQHCDAAPCEPVCPTFASVHSVEGLNAQVYNRCIGTRYCANNCPYKVRRFNWFDPAWPPPLQVQLNPEVSARCRGVMEKCTFCVQRIRVAQYRARLEARDFDPTTVVPACAQTCPTGVYTFGDLLQPGNPVLRAMREDPRGYQVLGHLNTKPAILYLKRVERA